MALPTTLARTRSREPRRSLRVYTDFMKVATIVRSLRKIEESSASTSMRPRDVISMSFHAPFVRILKLSRAQSERSDE